MSAARGEALSLYRAIMRSGRTRWEHPEHKEYIQKEARRIFRLNQGLEDPLVIEAKIKEGHNRMEIAEHYQTPYSRIIHSEEQTSGTYS